MSVVKFNTQAPAGASTKNVEYNTRASKSDSISFHNLPHLEMGDKQENRYAAMAYAEDREEEEKGKRGDRNHYRLILAFDRDVPTEEAKELAHQYLEKEFPKARAVVAVHQHQKPESERRNVRDYKHSHIHVWIDAREIGIRGKKIHMKNDRLPQLYKSWQSMYDREYGTNYAQEFGAKRDETARGKEERADAKANGLPVPEKPERASDKFGSKQFREKDLRDVGVINDQERVDFGERPITIGHSETDRTASAAAGVSGAIDAGKQAVDRGALAVESTISAVGNEVAGLGRAVETERVAGLEGLRGETEKTLERGDVGRSSQPERGGGIER
jgi:hypothetical protein